MTKLFAQPYNTDATGFYFETADEYHRRVKTVRATFGHPVEEFEIQFIDGRTIDCDLALAWKLSQANFYGYLDATTEWDVDEKRRFILAVGECGYSFDPTDTDPNAFDIDIYELGSLKELAEQFVEDGLFGDIPKPLELYIDYDAIARDLAVDYSETTIAGHALVYRCG